jgi:hypothetical protein
MSPLSTSDGLQLQPRDLDLLRELFLSRLLTLSQAADIHFVSKREMAKKRIQKLKAAGLIGVRTRKPYEPSLHFLTRIGFETIRERGLLSVFPNFSWSVLEQRLQVSDLTLRHELNVMDTKAAFFTAARTDPILEIAEFSTWPSLYQFSVISRDGTQMLVKPDGFIRLHQKVAAEKFEHVFFLELDRSTETLDTLARRAQAYLAYYRSGGLAERFGRHRSEYKDFPFRVLMVFKNAERRNNMAERLLAGSPPILTHVWLSTFDEVLAQPLGSIWVRPRDYRDAVAGTEYARSPSHLQPIYRRQTDRESHIEAHVQRQPLLQPTETAPENSGNPTDVISAR